MLSLASLVLLCSVSLPSVLGRPALSRRDCSAQCDPMQTSVSNSASAGLKALCTQDIVSQYSSCLDCQVAAGMDVNAAQNVVDSLVASCKQLSISITGATISANGASAGSSSANSSPAAAPPSPPPAATTAAEQQQQQAAPAPTTSAAAPAPPVPTSAAAPDTDSPASSPAPETEAPITGYGQDTVAPAGSPVSTVLNPVATVTAGANADTAPVGAAATGGAGNLNARAGVAIVAAILIGFAL